MKRIARSAIVAHSAAAVYDIVADIESYPAFLPWCRAATVHERAEGRTVATLSVGMRAAQLSFTTENANLPGEKIDLRLLKGPFKNFSAAWRFTPLGEEAAKIEFTMEYQFSSRLLAKALEPLFDTIANTMVSSFSRRADQLYGKPAD